MVSLAQRMISLFHPSSAASRYYTILPRSTACFQSTCIMMFTFNVLIIVACYCLELLSSISFSVGFNFGVVELRRSWNCWTNV